MNALKEATYAAHAMQQAAEPAPPVLDRIARMEDRMSGILDRAGYIEERVQRLDAMQDNAVERMDRMERMMEDPRLAHPTPAPMAAQSSRFVSLS